MSSSQKACPICHRLDSYRPVRPSGFWEQKVLALVGMRPYRCASCGHRTRFRGRRAPAPRPGPEPGTWGPLDSPAQFLRSEDDRDFKDLILEIRQAEKKMEQGDEEPQVS